MKKLINIVSWVSFLIIVSAIALFAVWAGAMVAGMIREALNVTGWWCLALSPVVLVVAWAVADFLFLGMKKMGEPYATWEEKNS